jgi:hypothetical protein
MMSALSEKTKTVVLLQAIAKQRTNLMITSSCTRARQYAAHAHNVSVSCHGYGRLCLLTRLTLASFSTFIIHQSSI